MSTCNTFGEKQKLSSEDSPSLLKIFSVKDHCARDILYLGLKVMFHC